MWLRSPWSVSSGAALAAAAILGLALFLFRPFGPPEAAGLAFRFVADLQNGRIDDAYQLTDKGGDVGTDLRVFAANEDVVFLRSSRHSVSLVSVRPAQSRAQRMMRIIRGAPVDPDVVYVNFHVGAPFLVRLRHMQRGWAVSYFEVHAE